MARYTIPTDNPFFGSPTEKQEIFCYGLRNPFRASFDPVTHDMLIGDVGEHEREEIDFNPLPILAEAKILAGAS